MLYTEKWVNVYCDFYWHILIKFTPGGPLVFKGGYDAYTSTSTQKQVLSLIQNTSWIIIYIGPIPSKSTYFQTIMMILPQPDIFTPNKQ